MDGIEQHYSNLRILIIGLELLLNIDVATRSAFWIKRSDIMYSIRGFYP